jgi:hypothetical protein
VSRGSGVLILAIRAPCALQLVAIQAFGRLLAARLFEAALCFWLTEFGAIALGQALGLPPCVLFAEFPQIHDVIAHAAMSTGSGRVKTALTNALTEKLCRSKNPTDRILVVLKRSAISMRRAP